MDGLFEDNLWTELRGGKGRGSILTDAAHRLSNLIFHSKIDSSIDK